MNKFLAPAVHRFLASIRDSEDEYAIQEGLEVWVDYDRFHPSTVLKCLQLCLIKDDDDSKNTHIWVLNSDGIKILESDSFVPPIVEIFRK